MIGTDLRELRERRQMTQFTLAERMEVSQPRVVAIESSDSLVFSTVKRYIEALGGKLEVIVRFPDDELTLEIGEE